MKKIILVAVLAAFVCSLAAAALAWDFKVRGETAYRYRYLTRTGQNDIFGTVYPDLYLGVNHLKTWPTPNNTNKPGDLVGVFAGESGFGADASMVDMLATLFPEISICKAIKVSGGVNLTSLGIYSGGRPYDNAPNGDTGTGAGYFNSLWLPIGDPPAVNNVPNSFVTLQWWKLGVKLPVFDLSLGYKTSKLGMGLLKHDCQRSSSSFSMTAYYGPWAIGFAPYFARAESAWDFFGRDSFSAQNPWRKDNDRDYFRGLSVGMTYKGGPLSFGWWSDAYAKDAYTDGNYVSRTYNALGAVVPGALPAAPARPAANRWSWDMNVWFKYFNGRVFANGDVNYFYQLESGRGVAQTIALVRQNRDQSSWLYGFEVGGVSGPGKLTLSYVRATGDDPSTRKTSEDAAAGNAGASSCFMGPWAYLMYEYYGTGSNWDGGGKGQPTNFHHVGLRVDYALAANLNVYGVYSRAWRDQANAFRLGGDYLHGAHDFDNDDIWAAQTAQSVHTAVPDSANDIGFEINLGMDWKILQYLTWRSKVAWWQPGSWWSYAYPNTVNIYANTVPGVVPVANRDQALVGLGRSIDPLFGFESVLQVDF